MDDSDRIGNVFSEEDDSFDDPAPMSNSDETTKNADLENNEVEMEDDEGEEVDDEEDEEEQEIGELNLEEEDFNLLTIEKVPMKTLTTRIGRVISEIMIRGEAGAVALFDVANKIVFQSSMITDEINTVTQLIINGLTKIFTDYRERNETAENGERYLSLLAAKVAVKNRTMKSEELLLHLVIFIDRLYWHADSFVRCRVYRLIAMIMEEENRYTESMKEQADLQILFTDEDTAEPEVIIPLGAKRRWMEKLTKTLLDKSPAARICAINALSLWDQNTVVKRCDGQTINNLIWKSLYDVDESARLTAARRLHITSEAEINRCMDYVEMSKDSKVRQAMVARLASDVHLLSFSENQRLRLINLLINSDSTRVRDVIHERLVPSWMAAAGEEINCLEIFETPKYEENLPQQFPNIIFQFLNPRNDPKAVHIFIKFATVHFIKKFSSQSNEVDLEQFLKDLIQLTDSECDTLGLLKRTTFRMVSDESDNVKKTFLRIFLTRCFLDVVFELSAGQLEVLALRNRALMFLTPDVSTFTQLLEEFCTVHLLYQENEEDKDESLKESILGNVLHVLNVAIKHGNVDFDKQAYQNALKRMLEAPDLEFSSEITETFVLTILDLGRNDENREEDCEWISGKAKRHLLSGSEEDQDLDSAMKEGTVADRMYLKSATMLLAMCKHEKVKTPSPGMSSLFKSLIPGLLGSANEQIQQVGLELIGRAASIDFDNCGPYLKLTRFLVQRDDMMLQSTGLSTIIRVIKARGFPDTAEAVFGDTETTSDEDEELLSHLIEKTVIALNGEALGQAVLDCYSMLSHGNYAWPKLMSVLLLTVFQKRNAHLQLEKVFKLFCKSSVKSLKRKICVIMGFIRAIHTISKTSEPDANCDVVGMTSSVCEAISRVPTVGEEDDQDDEICVEVKLVKKTLKNALAHPSGWIVRHVFNSFATSLRLECVPIDELKFIHERLVDAFTVLRFKTTPTTQIAFKRFLTNCEKAITLQSKVKGIEIQYDLKKVKDEEEVENPTSSTSGRSKKSDNSKVFAKKNSWDHGDSFSEESDDSFEYCPQPTRSRKRLATSTPIQSPKKGRSRTEEVSIEDDSFDM